MNISPASIQLQTAAVAGAAATSAGQDAPITDITCTGVFDLREPCSACR